VRVWETVGSKSLHHRRPWIARKDWFACHGSSTVVFSRFIPRTRLPTYLAAGLLRMPLRRFGIYYRAGARRVGRPHLFDARWLKTMAAARSASVCSICFVGHGICSDRVLLTATDPACSQVFRSQSKKLSAWEFWPACVFYPPVVRCVSGWIEVRGFSLPASANPGQQMAALLASLKLDPRSLMRLHLSSQPPHF